ncbi:MULTISPECIES: glycosyltransferase [unclassified Novosphingobium]|uniref:glycosyltransferase n=1 Tax=unclassified Novosphingobium TaxID=2644732 RepID=UPI0025DF44E6|nr:MULTISPECIES: glycosyltransferase [unclassified Novosphingobium]
MNFQVFHDPTGRRGRRMRWLGSVLLIIAILCAALFAWAMTSLERRSAPSLPTTLAAAQTHSASLALSPAGDASKAWLPAPSLSGQPPLAAETLGFYMPWDEASRRSLRANVGQLSWVAAGMVSVRGRDHQWIEAGDASLQEILAGSARTKLLLMIQNDSETGWDGENMARLLASPQKRRVLLEKVALAMTRHKAAGVFFDIENLPASAHEDYRALLNEARSRLPSSRNGNAATVMLAAPVADETWDLRAYARAADRVVLMAYDEHWQTGSPGPIASQAWFAKVVESAVARTGADRAIVAVGSYAFDWSDGQVLADSITVQQAWARAAKAATVPIFDPASGTTGFAYVDAGIRREVWMLDALSAWNQLLVLRQVRPAGVALWRLGSEDPGFWSVLSASRAGALPPVNALKHLPPEQGIELRGTGEVLRMGAPAEGGSRTMQIGAEGLIRSASYDKLSHGHIVERSGNAPRQIALSFDDGPDPRWTPQILDVLAKHDVPATFFVTGAHVLDQPALVKQIVAQGSELANHSTTHANLDRVSDAAVEREINATQRLVESYTGHSMHLFRAPYLGDADPDTAAELRVAQIAAQLGYLTVGLNVDPLDWETTDAATIAARTIDQVEAGTANNARRIVLLHDSGGDRSATVAALPVIIRELRARGYEFVPVSTLAGLTRDEAMPLLARNNETSSGIRGLFFEVLRVGRKAITWLFVAAISLGIMRVLLLSALAAWQTRRVAQGRHRIAAPEHLVPRFVSVLIPAFNEERVIEASVRRALATQGMRVEIIVIDDGSSDRTSAVVQEAFGLDPRVQLLTLKNGGKARALNQGLAIAKGDVIVALDADTRFEPDTIAKLARWFADPAIGAVAGNAKIGNRVNWLTKWQSIEYITAQSLERRALEALGAVTVVPGAVGAWRRAALDEVGGYPSDTLAEDQDLTIAVQRAGWRVACENDAIAWTEAPETVRALFRQRYRWAFGTLQCLWKHASVIGRGQPRGLAWFGLPQAWLFQIGLGLLSPMIDLALVMGLADAGLQTINHGLGVMAQDLMWMLAFWLIFSAVESACGALAYHIDGREGRLPLLRMLAMRFGYRQLLYAVVVHAVASALHGMKVRWGAQQRSGNYVNNLQSPIAQAMPHSSSVTARSGLHYGDEHLPPILTAA